MIKNRFLTVLLTALLIYLSGLILALQLMVVGPDDVLVVQVAKMAVSALHAFILVIPVYLISRTFILARILGLLLLAVYFSYLIFLTGYYGYFGFVPEIYTFGVGNIGDMSKVLDHYFIQIFSWREPALLFLGVAIAVLALRTKPGVVMVPFLLIPILLFSMTYYRYGSAANLAYTGNDSVIRRYGIVPFAAYSARDWFSGGGDYVGDPTDFPGNINDIFGVKNQQESDPATELSSFDRVSLLQIESFDREAITAQLNGIPVMPFVSELRKGCSEFENFFTLRSAGGSADAEFSVATGLLPSSKVPAIRNVDFALINTLYHILERNGIENMFLHNNVIGFYGRNHGYGQLRSVLNAQFLEPNDTRTEAEFATDALARLFEASDKSFYYFFNFHSHAPFRSYSAATETRFGITKGTSLEDDYLATLSEVDETIRQLFELQRDDYEAGRAAFLLTSDHQSGLLETDSTVDRLRIPFMICGTDIEPGIAPRVSTSIDIFPTILSLFGIQPQTQSIGSDLRSERENGVAVLPSRRTIKLDDGDGVVTSACGAVCDPFLNYTDQFISR